MSSRCLVTMKLTGMSGFKGMVDRNLSAIIDKILVALKAIVNRNVNALC